MADLRQPLVRHNDWRSLTPPAVGEWTPTLSVSVVVPTYAADATLPYVLAGLAAQTYPAHLLEVVVVDDGNQPSVELPEVRPESTRVVRVEQGWGRANACHTGVLASDGAVVHWLDSDMLAFREHVEAQLRWHHVVDYAVVLGTKRFVDPAGLRLTPAEVRDVVASGAAETLFDVEGSEPHKWVEGFWRRSDDLVTAGPRAMRVHVGATASLTRALYDAAGGMDTSLRLGEDIELGHRLGDQGGVLVPEHGARSWHLGRSHVMEQRDQVNRYNDAFLINLVPGLRPKRVASGRVHERPYLEVVVPTDGADADEVVACVDGLLDSDLPDLRVLLVGPWSRLEDSRRSPLRDPLLETRIVERTYRPEPRVRLVEQVPDERAATFRLTLPGTAWTTRRPALLALLDDLERTHHGLRVVRLGDAHARLERTAAVHRVERVTDQPTDALLDALLDRAFGIAAYDARAAGFVPTAEREVERLKGPVKPAMDPERSRRLLAEALDDTPATPVEAPAPEAEEERGVKLPRAFRRKG